MNRVVDTRGIVVGGNGSARFAKAAEHPENCRCGVHDKSPRACPYAGCDAVKPGIRSLGQHISWVHKRRRRSFTKVVIPDGTGWLTGVLRDPRRAAGLHLESLPKFSQWLHQQWDRVPHQFGKRSRAATKGHRSHASMLPADAAYRLPTMAPEVPAALGAVILELALAADVPTNTIVTALLCYGTEYLAKELRATHYAPQPRLPAALEIPASV